MTCGIYKITNKITGEVYIGSSRRIKARWSQHRGDLRRKRHCNSKLQEGWNKHGENQFVFEILRETEESFLLEVEQEFIDVYEAWKSYNISKTAGVGGGRSKKIGGATPRTFKLTRHAVAALPLVGKDNATEGIETLVRLLPVLQEAYLALAAGSKDQQAIAEKMALELGLKQWGDLRDVEILDRKGNVIGWII